MALANIIKEVDPPVELTQAEYDALTTAQKNDGTVYFITDGNGAFPTAATIPAENTSGGTSNVQAELQKKVEKANIVNNFTTTQSGYVADARALKTIADNYSLKTDLQNYAPKSHRSQETTYGVANASYYGHVKLSNSYTSSAGGVTQGVAASSQAVYNAYNTLNKVSESTSVTLASGIKLYTTGDDVICYKQGHIVMVKGVLSTTKILPTQTTGEQLLMTLPSGYRPATPVYSIQHGSNDYLWLMTVRTNGQTYINRYSNGNGSIDVPSGVWLPFTITFITS